MKNRINPWGPFKYYVKFFRCLNLAYSLVMEFIRFFFVKKRFVTKSPTIERCVMLKWSIRLYDWWLFSKSTELGWKFQLFRMKKIIRSYQELIRGRQNLNFSQLDCPYSEFCIKVGTTQGRHCRFPSESSYKNIFPKILKLIW